MYHVPGAPSPRHSRPWLQPASASSRPSHSVKHSPGCGFAWPSRLLAVVACQARKIASKCASTFVWAVLFGSLYCT
eukprot:8453305-Pyramimonas_sp.AAC.1